MAKLCTTDEFLEWDEREILVWHHRMNNFSFKSILRLYKRDIIPRKLFRTRKLPPCVACIFGNYHKRPWRTKTKHSDDQSGKPWRPDPGP